MSIKSIVVFCASSVPTDTTYSSMAFNIGKAIAGSGKTLVYGGGNKGLMGNVAHGCMNSGGKVIGIIPKFLAEKEHANHAITKLIFTQSMDDRKKLLFEMSECVLILPGGLGTMDEFFEAVTNVQLQLITHGLVVLNYKCFYDPLLSLLQAMVHMNLVDQSTIDRITFFEREEDLVKWLYEN